MIRAKIFYLTHEGVVTAADQGPENEEPRNYVGGQGTSGRIRQDALQFMNDAGPQNILGVSDILRSHGQIIVYYQTPEVKDERDLDAAATRSVMQSRDPEFDNRRLAS